MKRIVVGKITISETFGGEYRIHHSDNIPETLHLTPKELLDLEKAIHAVRGLEFEEIHMTIESFENGILKHDLVQNIVRTNPRRPCPHVNLFN